MNWFLFRQQKQIELSEHYDDGEAKRILQILAEELLPHYSQFDLRNPAFNLNKEDLILLNRRLVRLSKGEPLQYVLEKAWFYNMELKVNDTVLIPRPETEELVHWIIQDWKEEEVSVLDIGTGSGCIPMAIGDNIVHAEIHAIDVSEDALQLAQLISCEQRINIQFQQIDILDRNQWSKLGSFDVIVSNPPYIPNSEKGKMKAHVLDYEPHLALFVENNDPLIFYKEICSFAHKHLKPNGSLYFECNEFNAKDVVTHLKNNGFKNTTLKKDLQGKNRMIKASFNGQK